GAYAARRSRQQAGGRGVLPRQRGEPHSLRDHRLPRALPPGGLLAAGEYPVGGGKPVKPSPPTPSPAPPFPPRRERGKDRGLLYNPRMAAAENSFDVVSNVDLQEVRNGVHQAE